MSDEGESNDVLALHRNEAPDALLAKVPYARFLGLEAHAEQDALRLTMPGSEHLIGNPTLPALHGGSIGALLECTAIFQLMWEVRMSEVPKIISITVDYLRSGRIVDTHARAKLAKRGRRIANLHVVAFQDDESRPVATAHAHFLLGG